MDTLGPLELAHGVGRTYELPLPLYVYISAAVAAVVIAFVIRALRPEPGPLRPERRLAGGRGARGASVALLVVGVAGLVLCVASAIVDPGRGFTLPTMLFWVALVVGVTALSCIADGVWEAGDPWAAADAAWRLPGDETTRQPGAWLGPLTIYALFWFELVSGVGFEGRGVLIALVTYTVYSFAIRSLFGTEYRWADPFRILFGFAGRCAPLALRDDGIYYKGPLRELVPEEPMRVDETAALFVLLASTTLDNIRETVMWGDLIHNLGLDAINVVVRDTFALALFTLPFAGLFLGTVLIAQRWVPDGGSAMELARRLAPSLIPVGVAYVMAHNTSLLIVGIPGLIDATADLIGAAEPFAGYAASPKLVWFLEIAFIIGGHILAVLAAHRIAIATTATHSDAIKSQYALTALMSVLTVTTLWLLAQPLVTSG
ncbi:MAG TPA: hypothetical protein VNC78_07830 [Actinomycetota bacterium]|nr:hypothetical protein [Actinomycetota bacterium]